ncbi:TPA: hypothetical protein MB324_004204 [Klebsiella pneumoniae]|nr:hypothetical protein [Klebsiella pneumoniae]
MLKRAVILLPILFSVPAANALDADYENCLKSTSSKGNVEGFRDCVVAYANKTLPQSGANGAYSIRYGHDGAYFRMDVKDITLYYKKGEPRLEKVRDDFIVSAENWDNREKISKGYCVTLGAAQEVFNRGVIIRYYDRNNKFVHTSIVTPEQCSN